jgi:hypothetical protein
MAYHLVAARDVRSGLKSTCATLIPTSITLRIVHAPNHSSLLGSRERAMRIAAWTLRDVLDVLLVPAGLAILALVWPSWQALRRRHRFQQLIYEELLESLPSGAHDRWHEHLTRQFVHRRMIMGDVEASEFVLSLPARFTYELNQMWSSYARAEEAVQSDAVADAGVSWCYSLRAVCLRLRQYQRWRWRRSAMRSWRLNVLCRSWVAVIGRQHPTTKGSLVSLWADLVAERMKMPRRAVPNDGRDSFLAVEQSLDHHNPVS